LGADELAQVRRYAHALTEHPGVGPSRWTFWLLGSDTKDEIGGELQQQDRAWGHVTRADKYDCAPALANCSPGTCCIPKAPPPTPPSKTSGPTHHPDEDRNGSEPRSATSDHD
jgi:hypothetical protein